MAARKLTAKFVSTVKAKPDRVEYWDSDLPGFGLRVSAQGARTWILMYRINGRQRRLSLGRLPALSLAAARTKAITALAEVAQGRDPASKNGQGVQTVKTLAADYIERHAKPRKRSWKRDEAILGRDVLPHIGSRQIDAVQKADIIALLDRIVDRGAPIQANRVLAVVRKMFNWAVNRGYLEYSPCYGVESPSLENERDRVLVDDEIQQLWKGLDKAKMSKGSRLVLKLQLVTAQRKGEVVGAPKNEFDLENKMWTIGAERSKNGLSHRVPLSKFAVDLVKEAMKLAGDGDWLFPSPRGDQPMDGAAINHALKRNLETLKLENVVPHDLRRTVASRLGSMNIPRLVISKILNHVEKGVTAVYDRHSYDDEKREALNAWAKRLQAIVSKKVRS